MKVILTIAAGRRLTMSGLIPQLLAQEGWDEMHVWVNTMDKDDQAFLHALPALDTRIKLKTLGAGPVMEVDGVLKQLSKTTVHLGEWWNDNCVDMDAIYVRFDDDIVFVEKDTVKELVKARLQNPDPYLIFPVIINNGILAHILEREGKIKNPKFSNYTPFVFDPLVYSADMCFDIHEQFIKQVQTHGMEYFHIPDYYIDPQHISINCMVYFGKDIAAWQGNFHDCGEEPYITCIVPHQCNRNLMIMGSKVVSHLAFTTQRAWWDGKNASEDVKMYVGQLQTLGHVIPELQEKFNSYADFRKNVQQVIDYYNDHLTLITDYRNLHADLYNIQGFPVQHDSWNWKEIQEDIAQSQARFEHK